MTIKEQLIEISKLGNTPLTSPNDKLQLRAKLMQLQADLSGNIQVDANVFACMTDDERKIALTGYTILLLSLV